ncbi:MAG: hemolysin III family protein [Deltaproteobacteria bacterium]|nr:hemolysin III family protein [Deltaproteobacteria bacterium]MCB9478968.1 hemolysin III family protein [Deltaproteobacteria bacterium]MCB9487827.1 hemolysin III family protein [Deltaproteobacteria bacterium]
MNDEKVILDPPQDYSLGEEVANAVTHGLGFGLSVAALAVLVTHAYYFGDAWRVVSFSIFGATLILVYLASTLYHSFQAPKIKRLFRVFDHAAIYMLIAGTYTPFTLVNLRGPWGWAMFGVVWAMALGGVIYTTLFLGRYKYLPVAFYLTMGWAMIVALKPLMAAVPVSGLIWIAIGGAAYTLGVVFYLWEKLPYNHAIWHVFVMGGSVCHFFAMFYAVLPMTASGA